MACAVELQVLQTVIRANAIAMMHDLNGVQTTAQRLFHKPAMSAPERIAALLAEHPLRVKEIAERAEMTESAVRTYLSRGKGSRFTKLETGDWGLLARPSMASAGGQG